MVFSVSRTVALAGLSAALILPSGTLLAQDYALSPSYGLLSLSSGFLPDPIWVWLRAGGEEFNEYDDAISGGECAGHFADAPDLRIHYASPQGYPLSFYVDAEADTVLLVNTPDGQWHCNDDNPASSYQLNAGLTFDAPQQGQYDIWVGTYASPEGVFPDAILSITEGPIFPGAWERVFFGEDERVVLDPTAAPWSMIGLVEMTEGTCTGTLIGPSLVLTAAHCVANVGEDDNPPVTFRAGYENETDITSSRITGFHIVPGWRADEQDGTDYAFMYLADPIGDQLGWMNVGPLTEAEIAAYATDQGPDIMQAGYSYDQPDVQTGNLDCPLLRVTDENTMVHQCDTLQGDSGSPLFIADGAGYRIIGVESYTDSQPNEDYDLNIATYIGDVVIELARINTMGTNTAGTNTAGPTPTAPLK